jgi:hypothetical protein
MQEFLKRINVITVLFALFLSFPGNLYAQYDNEKDASVPLDKFYIKRDGPSIFRKILSKVTFGLSTGLALTTFKHEFEGFELLQNPGAPPVIYTPGATTGYTNWFNKAQPTTLGVVNGPVFNSSTEKVGFKSKSFNIPLRATVHVEIDRYRIGGGYSYEFTSLGAFKPITHEDEINNFDPGFKSFFLKKYFGSFGASVYRYEDYLLVADLNIGGYKLGKNFDNSLINKGLFFNLGVSVEREMSEYFRLFIRPSYDIKSFTFGIPESSTSVAHKFNAFYINVGATYRIPELRRCFIKKCNTQINHAHGNREYRSRMHPIYKKQNPHYGENYPTLIKYKGKNKYKLNPY